MMNKFLWMLMSCWLVLSSCQGSSTPPSPTKAEAYPSAVWHDGVATFTDPAFGITLDIPGDWRIVPLHDTTKTLPETGDFFFSPCLSTAPMIMPPCTSLSIQWDASHARSLNEIKSLIESNDAVRQQVIEQREMRIHELPALWSMVKSYGVESSDPITWTQTIILADDHALRVTAYGALSPTVGIIETIQSIDFIENKHLKFCAVGRDGSRAGYAAHRRSP
jgi:hypothetical protein